MDLSGCGQRSPGSPADDCFPGKRASTARGLDPAASSTTTRRALSSSQRLLVSYQAASPEISFYGVQ